ncbi:DUF1707 SHOCT-like domain-containing protein [Corynebacterium alimapuense]|uniref:DUF1707 domain-containing protein n=1 Tax=Corynebacterium alimapuense TaxID=1576874 RepID=A0A3M8K786_9CORY|nr:DUF1707 domain-containing protein [Corynebacterium alimapuense]RNE48625.1 hypothetical protein C5L39_09065 [Corynebacterium alimapuense]
MNEQLRLSDDDRMEAVNMLTAHFTAGRLDHLELDDRTDAVLQCETAGELQALFADLPPSSDESDLLTSDFQEAAESEDEQEEREFHDHLIQEILLNEKARRNAEIEIHNQLVQEVNNARMFREEEGDEIFYDRLLQAMKSAYQTRNTAKKSSANESL